jgi:DNA-binding response OmpR family regulator
MSEPFKILVVDDEPHIREVLEYSLKLEGFQVYTAPDGRTGLELARKEEPDLVLLDWMMPEMNGLQVLSELKRDDKTKDIPVFMLTAKSMLLEVGRALYEGADDYITKPFLPVELSAMIRSKLEQMAKADGSR